ncbi:hypothetical protein WA026_000275 [Henosepilachna vigintioctopunctata]|uniref:lysozyme n=1 Tax=Henosepilachna vigintioctopunctata TaxID=420089 RepID=A0AAW1V3C4_9CUCU
MINIFLVLYLVVSKVAAIPDFRCLMCICETLTNCTSKPCDTWRKDTTYIRHLERGCGPFAITPELWIEANRPVLVERDESENEKFKQCAETMLCSIWTVDHYLRLHSRDCDEDGKINCDDFLLVYNFGHSSCLRSSLDNEKLNKYNTCMNRRALTVLKLRHSKITRRPKNYKFTEKHYWAKRESKEVFKILDSTK